MPPAKRFGNVHGYRWISRGSPATANSPHATASSVKSLQDGKRLHIGSSGPARAPTRFPALPGGHATNQTRRAGRSRPHAFRPTPMRIQGPAPKRVKQRIEPGRPPSHRERTFSHIPCTFPLLPLTHVPPTSGYSHCRTSARSPIGRLR